MNGATEKGAEVTYHAALDRPTTQVIEDDSCRIVNISLKNLEQVENKNTATTYLYRVDRDSGWSEIHFDFENKRIKIQRLAEWDTTRSRKYAWKVFGVISFKEDKVLPEKKRIILCESVSVRKRYNILDFAKENRVAQGAFTPIGNPEVKEPAVPLQSQRF